MMEKKYNIWSFYLIFLCIGISFYSLYSTIDSTSSWLIAPPIYILLLVSILTFIFGVMGFKDSKNWQSKTRSWVTIILSLLLSIALFLVILLTSFFSSLGVNEHIKTIRSPDQNYTIDFYYYDAGATGSFGVRGELNGPLWFKKRIFNQKGIKEVSINWDSNNIVLINDKMLNLDNGDTFGY